MTASPGFLVLSANTPWVFALADCLTATTPATAMRFYDWANYYRLRPNWPEASPRLRRVMRALPPGYAGKAELLLRPLTSAMIDFERRKLRRETKAEPFVICPYPYLSPWVRDVPDDRLIYYSLDEYAYYAPGRVRTTQALEDEMVSRARLVICLSSHQAEILRNRQPGRRERIKHFPLGVLASFVNRDILEAPLPGTVGYVGNLTNRIDWTMVVAVAEQCREVRFHFHGNLAAPGVDENDPDWRRTRDRAFSLPNVMYMGLLPQTEVGRHLARYAMNWMPYDKGNGFNIASCPTKIMDALASGRPFVSTDIPEARLYPGRVHVATDAEDAARFITRFLAGDLPHDPNAQVAFAATQTWEHRAEELLEFLN